MFFYQNDRFSGIYIEVSDLFVIFALIVLKLINASAVHHKWSYHRAALFAACNRLRSGV